MGQISLFKHKTLGYLTFIINKRENNMKNKSSLYKSAILLTFAGLFSKVIGFLFRVPLTALIGAKGYGLYTYPYNIYEALLALSIGGMPLVIAKMISENVALDNHKEAHRVFKLSIALMLVIGTASSIILTLLSKVLIGNVWPEDAFYPLMGLVLAPLFVGLLSVYRGYFQGIQVMGAHAVSQITEAIGRFIIGLALAYLFIGRGIGAAAGGAAFGATSGALIGLLTIMYIYHRYNKQNEGLESLIKGEKIDYFSKDSKESIYKIFKLSIPISIGAIAGTLMPLIDSLTVRPTLYSIGMTDDIITELFGKLGVATTLVNFPLTIAFSVAISIVPAIATAKALKDHHEVNSKIEESLKMVSLLIFPASVGMMLVSDSLLRILFPTIHGGEVILSILSFSLIFMSINQVLTAILQGLGSPNEPVKNILIGSIIKIGISLYLMIYMGMGIEGAAIGTVFGYLFSMILNIIGVRKKHGIEVNLLNIVAKPMIASAIMGAIIFVLNIFIVKGIISLSMDVVVGAVAYFAIMLITGGIDRATIKHIFKK